MQEFITFLTHHLALSAAFALVVILLVLIEFIRAKQRTNDATPQEVTQMINHNQAVIIDIRPPESYRLGHIINALSFSPQDLRENDKKLEKFKEKPLIIVCDIGIESQKIAALLYKHEYDAYSLTGGLRAWRAQDLPLVKEKEK